MEAATGDGGRSAREQTDPGARREVGNDPAAQAEPGTG
jgi:hypothetical protein